MLATESDLRTALWPIIDGIIGTDVNVIKWDYQSLPEGAPQPNPPFITLGTTFLDPIGRETVYGVNSLGIQDVAQEFKWTIRVNVFGTGAWGLAHKLKFAFNKESVQCLLSAAGLSFNLTTQIIRAPHEKETKWEDRALFDLILMFRDTDTDDVGLIESIGISGSYPRSPDDPSPIPSSIDPIINL